MGKKRCNAQVRLLLIAEHKVWEYKNSSNLRATVLSLNLIRRLESDHHCVTISGELRKKCTNSHTIY